MEAHVNCKNITAEIFRNDIAGNSNAISILNINVQSLRSNYNSLEAFLFSLSKPVDIVCLTETFLFDND